MRGMMRNWEARFDASRGHLKRWRRALDGSSFTQTGRLWSEALALAGQGEYTQALDRLHEALAICDRTGETLVKARTLNTVGWVFGELQDHEDAIVWNKQSEDGASKVDARES